MVVWMELDTEQAPCATVILDAVVGIALGLVTKV
jgi:hypothetical protein